MNGWRKPSSNGNVSNAKRQEGGLSFFEGMRMLAGAAISACGNGLAAGDPSLGRHLRRRSPPAHARRFARPGGIRRPQNRPGCAELRPYQGTGVHWLRLVTRLGLGACLADDMGLGKTIQSHRATAAH